MSLISPGLVNAVGRIASGLFVDTWEVLERVAVTTSEGDTTYTETVESTGSGNLQQSASNNQRLIADRLGVLRPSWLYVPPTAAIDVSDRVRVNGTRYFSVADIAIAGALAAVKTVLMDETQEAPS